MPSDWTAMPDEAEALRAEVERLREAIAHAHGICVDASGMQCECDGYYLCNGCERRIADRASDAAEVLASAMTPKED